MFAVSPRRCESLIRCSILHRMTPTPLRRRPVLHKLRATFRGLVCSSLHCIRLPTTRAPWKYKFTRRSWNVALHEMISLLSEMLANPDPALGYNNGELRFWLGWAQQVAGDHAAAQKSLRQSRSELEPFLKEQPDNYVLIGDLALVNMGLGDKAAAFALCGAGDERAPARERCGRWSRSDRGIRAGGSTNGRAGPRHRGVAEAVVDTIRGGTGFARATHSCAAPARSDVRSAPERSTLSEIDTRTCRVSLSNFDADDTAQAFFLRSRSLLQLCRINACRTISGRTGG